MKRIVAVILSVILATSVLTACGSVEQTQMTLEMISEFANSPEGTKILEKIYASKEESSDAAKQPEQKETEINESEKTEPEKAVSEKNDSEMHTIGADDEKIINGIVDCFMPLTKIPRQSHHEEEVSEYLFNWAKERGYNPKKDKENNVIFDVPGTEGMEDAPMTILQGHMDMVIAVAEGKTFDPQKDGIKVINDGVTLKADGTSLGADDGMGIATALYIIEKNQSHGPLRIIFTTDEEDGMEGANALTKDDVAGAKYVINIDSENSKEVTNSSAASVLGDFSRKLETNAPTKKKAMNITISKLLGGHSGLDIDKGRVNGIKAMGCLLGVLEYNKIDYELASFEGGSANNAIPTKATVQIVFDSKDEDDIKETIGHFKDIISIIYDGIETDFELDTESCDVPDKVLTKAEKSDLIKFINEIHDGVYSMSQIVEGLVQSSSNFGLISFNPNKSETGTACTYIRSSDPEELETVVKEQLELAKACKIEAEATKRAEAWPVNPDSELVKKIQSAYYNETGTEISVVQTHAGLETGVFANLDPKLDIVSVGLDIKNPHTINETCYLATLPAVYRTLETVLAEIGKKK